jgi:hypothetical protein
MNEPHDPHQHDPHPPDEPDAAAPTADLPPWPMPALEAPVRMVFTGEPVDDDWPLGNTVTVEVIETDNPSFVADTAQARDEAEWAADGYTRPLVRIDTNYKESRPGPPPVELTRLVAVDMAAALLAAVEDTFHRSRYGRLDASKALALLQRLDGVDAALLELRAHTVADLTEAVAQ